MKKSYKSNSFDVPVVLFIFKRAEKSVKIIERIKEIAPSKMYLIGDGARNIDEMEQVTHCRNEVLKAIDWNCELIVNFSDINRGVYENIALGAKWVFEREESAIFLEDDNLPSLSFFPYCQKLLQRYTNDDRILWICGTNYLENYDSRDNYSYVFTQNLMPCGWASWSNKFNSYYDYNLKMFNDKKIFLKLYRRYSNKILFLQQYNEGKKEFNRKKRGKRYHSWDYHMALSLKYHDKLGISPRVNLIENIGVDEHSIHGGVSLENEMTRRFCTIKSFELEEKFKHPVSISVDSEYDYKVSKIIQRPIKQTIKKIIVKLIRFCFRLEDNQSVKDIFIKK